MYPDHHQECFLLALLHILGASRLPSMYPRSIKMTDREALINQKQLYWLIPYGGGSLTPLHIYLNRFPHKQKWQKHDKSQMSYQESILLDPIWSMSLSFLIFLIVIRIPGVNLFDFLKSWGFQKGRIHGSGKEKTPSRFMSSSSYLVDVLELPDLPDDDQDVWCQLVPYTLWVSIKMSWKAPFDGSYYNIRSCFLYQMQ